MRDLGSLNHFLGIQAVPKSYGILLHQQAYANRILEQAEFENPQLYRTLIGSLQYLTITRPDIQFAVHQLSQQMHQPLNLHFDNLKRLLRYIKGSSDKGIALHDDDLTLTGYVDSDWASNQKDRKSISGYCNFLGKSIISWQVKMQTTVARSSTEAEYRALATEASEIIWLRRLLEDFHIPQKEPTTVFCDNTSAIALANNPVFHARTKHIEVDCHFIRDCIRTKQISVHHICTEDQLADIFTKPLSTIRFKQMANKLMDEHTSSI